ncbi:MAG TPA: hypothetical protein DF613_12280 [Lachnospiraceae bacterium]|nr:hypothetical protein [Lachnospiraceae bacterium]
MMRVKKFFRQGIYALLLALFLAGTSIPARASEDIEAAEVSPQGPLTYTSFKASASPKQLAKGKFVVEVRGLSCDSGIKQVRMQVYSKTDKSNSHTYTAEKKSSGRYRVAVNIANHKMQLGKYKIKVVVTDKDGEKIALPELATYDFSLNKGTTSVKLNKAEKKVTMRLSGASVPGGIEKVEFYVHAKKTGAKESDVFAAVLDKKTGEYTAVTKISKLSSSFPGTYVARAKVYAACGVTKLLDEQEFVVSGCDGKLSVKLADEDAGTYRLKVSSLASPSGIEKVQFKVWRDSKKNAVFYDAKGSGDSRSFTMKLTDFDGSLGKYSVQAIVTMGNGKVSTVASDTFRPELTDYLYMLKPEKNITRKICIKNISRKGNITFAVWSDKNGKDDLTSYKAVRKGDTAKITFKNSALKHAGKVYIAAYVNGKEIKTISVKIPASDLEKNGWYYEKYNGKVYKFYYKNGSRVKNLTKILNIGNSEDLYIEVNRRCCTVTVFARDGKKDYIIPVISFACSVGKASTPTPRGTYYTDRKHRWKVLMGPSYGQYATHVMGGVYFHSVAGSSRSVHNLRASDYNRLGSPASHGCIRLCVRDAKWIYDHCALKTKVKIFDSSYKGPLGKPKTIKISGNYDPTDPALH